MTAAPVLQIGSVTPGQVRRRRREQHVRGPVARPVRLAAPGGRPQQPDAPVLAAGPVALRAPSVRPVRQARPAAAGGVRLTDRGIAVIVSLMALIVVATAGVGLVSFFSVSNAPLDATPGSGHAQAVAAAAPGQLQHG